MTIIAALFLVALGVAVAEVYNWRIRRAEMRIRLLQGEACRPPRLGLQMRSIDAVEDGLTNSGAPRPGQTPLPPWFMDEFKKNGQVAARYTKGRWERV